MMVQAYLYDEAPMIGAGLRRVIVEREGRVWVRLINPNTLAVCKVRAAIWAKVNKRTVAYTRHKLKKEGMRFIETVDLLALPTPMGGSSVLLSDQDTLAREKAHKARVEGLRRRLKRAITAIGA